MNDPDSSPTALRWSIVITFIIMLSVLVLFVEKLAYKKPGAIPASDKAIWVGLELAFAIVFTLEAGVRFAVWDAFGEPKLAFFKNGPNICDILSVVPAYTDLIYSSAAAP